MRRKTLKNKRYKRHKKSMRNKSRRNGRRNLRAGNSDKIMCSMCEQMFEKDARMYTPRECLNKYGSRAHKICEDCWWGKFAVEGESHRCPGCEKNIPLTSKKYEEREPVILDLTED